MDANDSRFSRRMWLSRTGMLLGGSLLNSRLLGANLVNNEESRNEFDPWSSARSQLVLNPRLAYFDTAQFGPSLRAVLASEYRAQETLHTDPAGFYSTRHSSQAVETLCNRLGTWLGCTADEVAFTRGAAAGLIQCGQALSLQAGDEILIHGQLPEELQRFWRQQAQQHSLVLKSVTLPMPLHNRDEVVAAFDSAMSERTRVLACSHIQRMDGAILPVRELCQLARARGVMSMIDGTLSLGALQFSVRELDCDVYGASLCHWLNGPHETGVVYVREQLQSVLQADFAGSVEPGLSNNRAGWPRLMQRWPDDFIDLAPQFQSLPTALAWQENIGRARIEARLRELHLYARLRLQSIAGVELLTPIQPGMWLNVLSLRASNHYAAELADWLRNNDRVIVSGFNATQDGMNVLRISLHVYNSHDEIERLTQGLQRALRA